MAARSDAELSSAEDNTTSADAVAKRSNADARLGCQRPMSIDILASTQNRQYAYFAGIYEGFHNEADRKYSNNMTLEGNANTVHDCPYAPSANQITSGKWSWSMFMSAGCRMAARIGTVN